MEESDFRDLVNALDAALCEDRLIGTHHLMELGLWEEARERIIQAIIDAFPDRPRRHFQWRVSRRARVTDFRVPVHPQTLSEANVWPEDD